MQNEGYQLWHAFKKRQTVFSNDYLPDHVLVLLYWIEIW